MLSLMADTCFVSCSLLTRFSSASRVYSATSACSRRCSSDTAALRASSALISLVIPSFDAVHASASRFSCSLIPFMASCTPSASLPSSSRRRAMASALSVGPSSLRSALKCCCAAASSFANGASAAMCLAERSASCRKEPTSGPSSMLKPAASSASISCCACFIVSVCCANLASNASCALARASSPFCTSAALASTCERRLSTSSPLALASVCLECSCASAFTRASVAWLSSSSRAFSPLRSAPSLLSHSASCSDSFRRKWDVASSITASISDTEDLTLWMGTPAIT
mmetsp:Transcript_23325/g.75128  ORF Transcript_23325/g.75128 Transcript_23325/m.75128 type:complete len:287 (-) Transcript_23325:148-1008(-)